MKILFTRGLPLFSACAALVLPVTAQEKREDAPVRPNVQRTPATIDRTPGDFALNLANAEGRGGAVASVIA